ncbi:type I-F CRISPR-associated protein Csy1 [Enterobacteriaceae bacterium YMB-R22]|uniref:type I-F CRISPR-associated protein Csy1 n=1 Tax=Tenebrionicola larvae TaxID=2815733 RepID=UPI002010CA68|nr:type I-F CRISPR-associated protein Csy1 [Tenebrionicola larvae]MBV4411373.1 type I-F CRISPR-associated protein Csy1 [Tenebrionicola larvae]
MSQNALTAFIADYIFKRRQSKLALFDKNAALRLAGASASQQAVIAQQRCELEQRYTPQNWLTDAASRADQIALVTHAAKFTHGDSKSSSVYCEAQTEGGYLSSAALKAPVLDVVGNAAALDVAKFLQTEIAGDSLLACLKRGDVSALSAYAETPQQLNEWVTGFSRALAVGKPASHRLAKQVYFPVGAGYHLLGPLFASSLAHAVYQKIAALRSGEDAKDIRQALREKKWHPRPLVAFPQLAEMRFGGTKPQNISALNSARGGRTWLLSSRPPEWITARKPPQNLHSFFAAGGRYDLEATPALCRIAGLITGAGENKNCRIRRMRDGYIDELIDALFAMAAELQQTAWQGWSLGCPKLKQHQQLWLDPGRIKNEDAFAQAREKDDWQHAVAEDFARWLNHRLRQFLPDVGLVEKCEWQTWPRFRQQLRVMEKIIREALK